MRLAALLLPLCLSIGAPVLAAQPAAASRESVERLYTLTQMDQMLKQMGGQMAQVMGQAARSSGGGDLTAGQQEILQRYLGRMGDLMFSDESIARLRRASVQIYLDNFTEREVEDMIHFYESGTGRAVVRKMPLVMQQSMQLGVDWLQILKPDMDRLIAEMQAEISAQTTPPAQ